MKLNLKNAFKNKRNIATSLLSIVIVVSFIVAGIYAALRTRSSEPDVADEIVLNNFSDEGISFPTKEEAEAYLQVDAVNGTIVARAPELVINETETGERMAFVIQDQPIVYKGIDENELTELANVPIGASIRVAFDVNSREVKSIWYSGN